MLRRITGQVVIFIVSLAIAIILARTLLHLGIGTKIVPTLIGAIIPIVLLIVAWFYKKFSTKNYF